jgi:DNA-binding Lrp family transcriptional regulator
MSREGDDRREHDDGAVPDDREPRACGIPEPGAQRRPGCGERQLPGCRRGRHPGDEGRAPGPAEMRSEPDGDRDERERGERVDSGEPDEPGERPRRRRPLDPRWCRGGLEVFVDIRLRPEVTFEDFATARASGTFPEILDAVHVTGAYDYVVHAVVRDAASLDRFVRRLKREAGVSQSLTRLAMRESAGD